ncbi:MAG TPA: hypothetical protein VF981_14140 [Gemmatimonadaceae bacterium]
MAKNAQDAHPSIRAREALLSIATLYPALIRRLVRDGSSSAAGRISGNPETPLPYRESASIMLGEVSHMASYLGQRLIFESTGSHKVTAADLPDRPDERLALIGRDLIGHFAPDVDADSRAFALDCEDLAHRALVTAYPEGVTWLEVPNESGDNASRREPTPCAETGCTGRYRMRAGSGTKWLITVADPATWPPLTCSADACHVVTGNELSRAIAYAKSNGTTHWAELRRGRVAA